MNTLKLYKENVYLTECEAVVTDIFDQNGSSAIVLDRTVFFPEGGGQSSDTGSISGVKIKHVSERDGTVLHIADEHAPELKIGDKVFISIDWERRFDNMQRHCGEHILSGKFFSLFGGVNRGFHMGDDYMTIDIAFENDSEYKEVTHEMARQAEFEANQAIWLDLPVSVREFEKKEDAEKLPLRKKLAIEHDITIVTVGDISSPADSVACCGTHPSSAGQVGMIKIYKIEPNKGMSRIFFDAGRRAFTQYQERFDVLTGIENELSAGYRDVREKFKAMKEKNRTVRERLYKLTSKVISDEKDILKNELAEGKPVIKEYSLLTSDDIISLGRALAGSVKDMLFLIDLASNTVFLFSDSADCGKLVKDNVSVFAGKGGGNKQFARAIFSKHENACMFIDAVIKLRR